MKRTFRFNSRFVLSFFMSALFSVVIIGGVLYCLNTLNANLKTIVNENVSKILLTNTLEKSLREVSHNVYTVVLALEQSTRTKYYDKFKANWARYDQAWDKLKKTTADTQEKELQIQIEKSGKNIRKLSSQVIELDIDNKHHDAVIMITNQLEPEIIKLVALIEQNVMLNNKAIEKIKADAVGMYNIYLKIMIFMLLIVLAASAINTWITFRSLNKPINQIIKSLNEGSTQVTATSVQLLDTAQQLAGGSAEQASAIEETSSILEESSAMLQQNSGNTKQAAELSQQALESADRGNNEMQEMMNSIQEIKKSSDQIAKIIKVIDDIAFQTNILALNAAVEAARAGESGLGFAVVAEEVRNLAQRSAQAAKDTAGIIETNIELSGRGVAVADKVRGALNEITNQAKKVSELMDQISIASQEQSEGINQVYGAMSQIELTTQQNVANSEKSAIAADELKTQAENLKKIIQGLSFLINGTAALLNEDSGQKPGSAVYSQGSNQSESKNISPEDIIPLDKDSNYF